MASDLELLTEAFPALRELPGEPLRELQSVLARMKASPGEYLFRAGQETPANAFYLVSATAEILVGPPGDEQPVSVSGPGELLGWLSVFTTDLFPVSARVVEAGDVLRITADALRDLMDRYPSVARILASAMARHLKDLLQRMPQRTGCPTAFRRAETFPFRMKVGQVMSAPAVALDADESAWQAAVAMDRARVSSVVVCRTGLVRGIVTERDLVRRVFAKGLDPNLTSLETIMSSPVAALGPDEYLYRAMDALHRHRVRHLPVVDDGELVGMLSLGPLLALATSETLATAAQIERADSLEALASAHAESHLMCAQLLDEGVPGNEVSRLLSRVNRDFHVRVLELTLAALEDEGHGRPPVGFSFILMGSHGREENHFGTDQDHGMILADYPPENWPQVEPYFMLLGTRVTEGLARVGFDRCRGQVMSSNPVWRKPIREWRDQIRGWYANPSSAAVRYSTLFYDFQSCWGDSSLAAELRDFITHGIRRNHQLLQGLYAEASRHRVPLNLFHRFITEKSGPHKGQLDLKGGGFLFVVECARILALRHGVTRTGTVERLEALAEKGVIPPEEAEFVKAAHKTLFEFLLCSQVEKLRAGESLNTHLDPRALPIQERYVLRHALEATSRLQGLVHASFGEFFL